MKKKSTFFFWSTLWKKKELKSFNTI